MATYRNTPAYGGGGLGARFAVARVITTAAALAAAIIVLAIVLRVLNANPSNSLVSAVHDAGKAIPLEVPGSMDRTRAGGAGRSLTLSCASRLSC